MAKFLKGSITNERCIQNCLPWERPLLRIPDTQPGCHQAKREPSLNGSFIWGGYIEHNTPEDLGVASYTTAIFYTNRRDYCLPPLVRMAGHLQAGTTELLRSGRISKGDLRNPNNLKRFAKHSCYRDRLTLCLQHTTITSIWIACTEDARGSTLEFCFPVSRNGFISAYSCLPSAGLRGSRSFALVAYSLA